MALNTDNKISQHPDVTAEIVPDISEDSRLVRTSELPSPCSLSCAVESQFLAIIYKEKWWEALKTIHLSRKGCHGVLFQNNGSTSTESPGFPFLVSSALIQSVTETAVPDEDTLLTRDPLFRGRAWQILSNKRTIAEQLSLYADKMQREFGIELNIDPSRLPDTPATNADIEEGIIQAVGADNITELIRLTGDDANRAKNIYHGLQYFSALQIEDGIPFSFGISYETLANTFDVLSQLYGAPCCLRLSEHRMKPNEPKTQKLLILNGNLAQAMSGHDWRRVAILLRKTNRSCP